MVTATLHEAMFWEPLPDGRLLCTLCPHRCHLADGVLGACGARANLHGTLVTLVYDRVIARELDPIEKKPLFHFHPGSTAYSIATVGCCLDCAHCQNWEISQWPKQHLPRRAVSRSGPTPAGGEAGWETLASTIPGEPVTPAAIVADARRSGARSIAYTYTEPTIFYELAYDTAALARAAGLCNVFVTSGFIAEAPLRRIAPLLDAVNVDLKHFRADSYRRIAKGALEPVLEAIRLYHALGVWTEVTTLVIPGVNDSEDDLRGIAAFVRSVGRDVPWHVTRFHPAYRMMDRPPTPVATLRKARAIGLAAGLRHVYTGNVPGEGGENTCCPGCGALLIERYSVRLRSNRIRDGRCPECRMPIAGVGMDGATRRPDPV